MNFKERYDNLFGSNGFNKLLKSQKQLENQQYIRFNMTKVSKSFFFDFLKKQRVKFSSTDVSNLVRVEKSFFNLSSSVLSLNGCMYLQEYASSIPVFGLFEYIEKNIQRYRGRVVRVVDACSSPGSKLSQLIDYLEFLELKYEVVALEPNEGRLVKLMNNLQKQDLVSRGNSVRLVEMRAEEFDVKEDEYFDFALLDVPCSGNLITDRSWLRKRDMAGIVKNASLQRKIFDNLYRLVKKGGVLVYSTCSLEPEENEKNVDLFVKKYGLSLFFPVKLSFDTKPLIFNRRGACKVYRFVPFKTRTQGFFLAYFKKI